MNRAAVDRRFVESLGLNPEHVDLASDEAIAAALRRAAAFLCPCSARTLRQAVLEPLFGLHDRDDVSESTERVLEALVAHGDLLELGQVDGADSGVLLYAAPPTFVRRSSGGVVLLGVASDGVSILTDELRNAVQRVRHVRLIPPLPDTDVSEELLGLGFVELPQRVWMKAPRVEEPAAHLDRVVQRLVAAPPCGELPGLTILDQSQPVRYYRGRWKEPSAETGRFVARRPQAYGAALWCFAELEDGKPVRLIDLPVHDVARRGCDEAWRLQAAIDRLNGTPQVYRVAPSPGNASLFAFFSPVPLWAHRRWDTVGRPAEPRHCLFAYEFASTDHDEERAFIAEYLWMEEVS